MTRDANIKYCLSMHTMNMLIKLASGNFVLFNNVS